MLSKAEMSKKSKVQVPPSPQGIPTYIRRGISFGKLSRVPMCNIQDAGKTLYAQCYGFQNNISFPVKYGMHASSSPRSNFITLPIFRVGLDTHAPTHPLTPKSYYK